MNAHEVQIAIDDLKNNGYPVTIQAIYGALEGSVTLADTREIAHQLYPNIEETEVSDKN